MLGRWVGGIGCLELEPGMVERGPGAGGSRREKCVFLGLPEIFRSDEGSKVSLGGLDLGPTPDREVDDRQCRRRKFPSHSVQSSQIARAGQNVGKVFKGGVVSHQQNHGFGVVQSLEQVQERPGRGVVDILSELNAYRPSLGKGRIQILFQGSGYDLPRFLGSLRRRAEDPVRDQAVFGQIFSHQGCRTPSAWRQRALEVGKGRIVPAGLGMSEKEHRLHDHQDPGWRWLFDLTCVTGRN